MIQESTEKSKKGPAKSPELALRIRNAAAAKFLSNCTDATLAEQNGVSVDTISDWKRRPEWLEETKAIASDQMAETYNAVRAMAPIARDVLQDLLRDGPPGIKLRAAHEVLELALFQIKQR